MNSLPFGSDFYEFYEVSHKRWCIHYHVVGQAELDVYYVEYPVQEALPVDFLQPRGEKEIMEWIQEWMNEWMNEYKYEWMNARTNECKNEWMQERMKARTNEWMQ